MVCTIFLFTKCFQPEVNDPRGGAYAGSAKCIRCHPSVSSSYAHTAHYLSTQIANEGSVMGKFFKKDSNELFINDSTRIIMEKEIPDYTRCYIYIIKKLLPCDLIWPWVPVKGQTYLSWHGKGLYQRRYVLYHSTSPLVFQSWLRFGRIEFLTYDYQRLF